MFPQNMDYFIETVLFEMDLQVEYNDYLIEEWTILFEDDSNGDDQITV